MKVLLINGSPNAKGCTYTALNAVAESLNEEGVTTSFFHIGKKPVHGCVACNACAKTGKCVYNDDPANEMSDLIAEADGVVIGSPVYYAGPNGALCALLDRVFYSSGSRFAFKPGAAIVSCRRGGSGSAFDRLNKYFTISRMPIVSSQYWNGVHGTSPEDVLQDKEGLQIMHTLGKNMAWLLHSIQKGNAPLPQIEEWTPTNFIR